MVRSFVWSCFNNKSRAGSLPPEHFELLTTAVERRHSGYCRPQLVMAASIKYEASLSEEKWTCTYKKSTEVLLVQDIPRENLSRFVCARVCRQRLLGGCQYVGIRHGRGKEPGTTGLKSSVVHGRGSNQQHRQAQTLCTLSHARERSRPTSINWMRALRYRVFQSTLLIF